MLKASSSKKTKQKKCVAPKIGGTGGTDGTISNDPVCSVPPEISSSGTRGTALITFTRVTSRKTELSKRYWLGDDEAIQKKPAADMTDGIAERLTMPFSDFQHVLSKATTKQAAVYGSQGLEYPDKVRLVVACRNTLYQAENIINIQSSKNHTGCTISTKTTA